MSSKEMINYIEKTVSEKGYNMNAFKIEQVYGEIDVVWNVARYPHILCEYYRGHGIKIAPVKGSYGLTSLIFEAEAFPKGFYDLVDDLPVVYDLKTSVEMYNTEKTFDYLNVMYPSIVGATVEHYPRLNHDDIIQKLIKLFKFDDIIKNLGDGKYLVNVITNWEWNL